MYDDMTISQQSCLVEFLRAIADGERLAEQARCRLCEVRDFDPYDAFKKLQGGWHKQRGWLSAMDLHGWLGSQPHHLSHAPLEEVASMMTPYVNVHGELRYEGFLRLVLPKESSNGWLKEMALVRSSQASAFETNPEKIGAEAAYRICQVIEAEVDMNRHLKFHRGTLRELGVHKDAILRFLDSDQGVCAGLGGLISPGAVRGVLVARLQAMTPPQCDALLRRINPTGACLASFSDLLKYLSPPMPPFMPTFASSAELQAYSSPRIREAPLSPRSPARSPERLSMGAGSPWKNDLGAPTTPLVKTTVDTSFFSPASPYRQDTYADYHTPRGVRSSSWSSPAGRRNFDNPHTDLPNLKRPWSPGRKPYDLYDYAAYGKISPRGNSPDRYSPLGMASTQASSPPGSPLSPRSGSRRPTWWPASMSYLPASPLHDPGLNASFSSTSPAGYRRQSLDFSPAAWPSPSRYPNVLSEAKRSLLEAVLRKMAAQAEGDARLEDAKALLPSSCTIEAVFATLDRHSKGYVSDTDLWQFTQDFGGSASFSSLVALLHEVHLRQPKASFCVQPGRLTLREFGTLVLPIFSPELEAIQKCDSDIAARTELYLSRNSEPCPTCGARVQRSASAAGCPTVRCVFCGTSFRCFKVVGDYSWDGPAPALPEWPLTVNSQYHVSRLLANAARAAEDLERDRTTLSLAPGMDLGMLSDIFNHMADGRSTISEAGLRRAFLTHGLIVGEKELRLLCQRYGSGSAWSSHGSVKLPDEILFPDFARQLQPHKASSLLYR
eukprot:TRINITY_DN25979_c0_g2_i1.p1 TRINITY_DN25979_c0_g2~~TRINITY_DN25979_c0_g2_i1.p1  ORF type:complete len:779 (+),score=132.92 TRINITY_DN25979_c0_g2_i1:128-2464(+)